MKGNQAILTNYGLKIPQPKTHAARVPGVSIFVPPFQGDAALFAAGVSVLRLSPFSKADAALFAAGGLRWFRSTFSPCHKDKPLAFGQSLEFLLASRKRRPERPLLLSPE